MGSVQVQSLQWLPPATPTFFLQPPQTHHHVPGLLQTHECPGHISTIRFVQVNPDKIKFLVYRGSCRQVPKPRDMKNKLPTPRWVPRYCLPHTGTAKHQYVFYLFFKETTADTHPLTKRRKTMLDSNQNINPSPHSLQPHLFPGICWGLPSGQHLHMHPLCPRQSFLLLQTPDSLSLRCRFKYELPKDSSPWGQPLAMLESHTGVLLGF